MPNKYLNKTEALTRLNTLLTPGATVYTLLRHVSASGMQRTIDMFVMQNNEPVFISHLMAAVSHYSQSGKHEGLTCRGAGMDMGFALVYDLGSIVWPNGTPEPHGTRNGTPDRAGGYALKHRWL